MSRIFVDAPNNGNIAPTLAIAIPTYNDASTIADTLASIRENTCRASSVLVCDDCSGDNTIDIVGSFPEVSKIIIQKQNVGLAGNWNRCVKEFDADYLWILHSDDWIAKTAIACVYDAIIHFDPGVILSGARFLPNRLPDSDVAPPNPRAADWKYLPPGTDAFIASLSAICSSVVVKRSLYSDVGLFPEACPYSPDEDLWPRMALRDSVLVRTGDPLTFVRTDGEHEMFNTWRKHDFMDEWNLLHNRLKECALSLPVMDHERVMSEIERKRIAAAGFIGKWRNEERSAGAFSLLQRILRLN